jgi:hypothetical protein
MIDPIDRKIAKYFRRHRANHANRLDRSRWKIVLRFVVRRESHRHGRDRPDDDVHGASADHRHEQRHDSHRLREVHVLDAVRVWDLRTLFRQ